MSFFHTFAENFATGFGHTVINANGGNSYAPNSTAENEPKIAPLSQQVQTKRKDKRHNELLFRALLSHITDKHARLFLDGVLLPVNPTLLEAHTDFMSSTVKVEWNFTVHYGISRDGKLDLRGKCQP